MSYSFRFKFKFNFSNREIWFFIFPMSEIDCLKLYTNSVDCKRKIDIQSFKYSCFGRNISKIEFLIENRCDQKINFNGCCWWKTKVNVWMEQMLWKGSLKTVPFKCNKTSQRTPNLFFFFQMNSILKCNAIA